MRICTIKIGFCNKMSVALKEINETGYWLDLLKDSGYLSDKEYISLYSDYEEIIKMLISTVKTSKK